MSFFLSPGVRCLTLAPALLLLFSPRAHAQSDRFLGSWHSPESSVRYDISKVDGQVQVVAYDASDGEVLNVTEVRVASDKVITFHLFTSSTTWNVDIQFSLVGKATLEEVVTGDGQAEMKYYREGSKDYKKAFRTHDP